MGFRIWIPRNDRGRILELVSEVPANVFLEDLPLNYDNATLDTIAQIDVLWLKGRSIARAFEVEHTTAVYSGLLRMADLLALQPNMDIKLHIVASDERRDKVFQEIRRPVFSLLNRGPLSDRCTFISYVSVESIRDLAVEQLVSELCSATPKVRHTSGTVRPLERPTSASRSLPIICSRVCHLRGILTSVQTAQAYSSAGSSYSAMILSFVWAKCLRSRIDSTLT